MAYSVAWNETTPVGAATLASDIDLEIRNLKVSISERMSQLVDWDTDATDPKVLLNAALPAGGSWNTGGNDLEIADGLGWGGGRVIDSSDEIHALNISDLGIWMQDDIQDSATQNTMFLASTDITSLLSTWYKWIALRAGTVVGIWANLSTARTAGELSIGVQLNANYETAVQVVFDGSGSNESKYSVVAKANGVDFVAGDSIGVWYTTNGSWAPTTADVRVGLQVAYDP